MRNDDRTEEFDYAQTESESDWVRAYIAQSDKNQESGKKIGIVMLIAFLLSFGGLLFASLIIPHSGGF